MFSLGRVTSSDRAREVKRLTNGLILNVVDRILTSNHPRRLSVMIFHRVVADTDPFLASEPDATVFAAIMRIIRDCFRPLSLAEGLRRLDDGTLPRRAVCVTFDDGYADNLLVAAPILKSLEIPAIVFVASSYLDGLPMWNDRIAESIRRLPGDTADLREFGFGTHHIEDMTERAKLASSLIQQLKYSPNEERERLASAFASRYASDMVSPMLTRPQLLQLHSEGIEIGGHTVTHPILALADEKVAFREIADNKEELEGMLGQRLRYFAYPNGKPDKDFAPIHTQMAKRLGYQAALTTYPGVATAETDRFRLPRFTPWDRTPTRFAIRLLMNMRHLV